MMKMRHAALLGMLAVVCWAEEEEAAPSDPGTTAPPSFSNQVSAAASKTSLQNLATNGATLDVVDKNGNTVRMTTVSSSNTKANNDVEVSARYTGTASSWDTATKNRASAAVAAGLGIAADRVTVTSVTDATTAAQREAETLQNNGVIVVFLIVNSRAYAVILPVPTPGGDDGLSDGAIAGIVVGCVVGAGLIAFLVVWFCCCQEDDKPEEKNESADRGVEGGSTHEPNHGE